MFNKEHDINKGTFPTTYFLQYTENNFPKNSNKAYRIIKNIGVPYWSEVLWFKKLKRIVIRQLHQLSGFKVGNSMYYEYQNHGIHLSRNTQTINNLKKICPKLVPLSIELGISSSRDHSANRWAIEVAYKITKPQSCEFGFEPATPSVLLF